MMPTSSGAYVHGGTYDESSGDAKEVMQFFLSQKFRRPDFVLSLPRPMMPSSPGRGKSFSSTPESPGTPLREKVGTDASATAVRGVDSIVEGMARRAAASAARLFMAVHIADANFGDMVSLYTCTDKRLDNLLK
uniref:Uncharacterized protein n=1 Tax=Chrysotila carterae TaxID=13221 RepID=A0A7S4EWB1_CHRCT